MSETKFSKGPWSVAPVDLRDGRYWSVCTVPDAEAIDIHEEDNGHANAHLIAAAPDLYAALSQIVDSVARTASGEVCQTSDFTAARAALSRARGET